jgi:hypothetical protein
LPLYQIHADNLPYNSPDRSYASNPYSLNPTNELFAQTMKTVLTCTGAGDYLFSQIKGITNDLLAKSKKGAGDFSSTISKTSNLVSTAGGNNMNTEEIEKLLEAGNQKSDDANRILEKEQKQAACLNSIAYTLAKQNLSSMQNSMMNWVQTGFKGDPFYIRDVDSYTGSISKNILKSSKQLC